MAEGLFEEILCDRADEERAVLTLFGPKFDSYLQTSKNGAGAGFARKTAGNLQAARAFLSGKRLNDRWEGQQPGEVKW